MREIRFGHLDPAVARTLLCRPSSAFPEDAIPPEVAKYVIERTGAQPFLVQLYGHLIVRRLNDQDRRRATLEDVEEVEASLLAYGEAGYYFRNTVHDAPPPARSAMIAAARGMCVETDAATRRWLESRCLLDGTGRLTVPVLGRFLREEEITG